jgi:methionyl-tRNA synthetase
MQKNYYITTPIYYVNDKPHIGHTYTNLAADILARFKRLDGYNVIFLTGTDEHGQKVEKSAINANMAPQDFVDKVSKSFLDLCDTLNLSNDDFIRTTQDRHKIGVIELWKELEKNGYIYKSVYSGWYALSDEAFYGQEELVKDASGNLVAPSGSAVQWREEESYFFKLSAFQDILLDYYEKNPDFIAPKSRLNEITSFVKSGLKDLSISRSTFNWGIPTPNDDKHVIYVWLDALTNYITALGYPNKEGDFKDYFPQAIHLIGKDIIRFHCVYFPAFLMGAKLPLPKKVFAHGWWLNRGEKISKSKGNAIDPHTLIEKYGLDSIRYFLFKEVPFGNDGDFSDEALISRINNELANEYGNLLQRTLSIVNKNFDGILYAQLNQEQKDYLKSTEQTLAELRLLIDKQDLYNYLDKSWSLIRYANSYINDKAPWKLIKDGNLEEAKSVLYFVCEIIRRVSLCLSPYMPESVEKIFSQLNLSKEDITFAKWDNFIANNHRVNLPQVLFNKIIVEENK